MMYAMEPQALARRVTLMSKIESGKPAASAIIGTEPNRKVSYTVSNGVAHVPVRGVLADSRSWMDDLFGDGPELTYTEMADAILAAADDTTVSSIQLDVDSPGGELNGLTKAVEAVQLARTAKPVEAVVGSMAASAAYWIASQSDRITAMTELSQVGSVGVAVAYWKPEGVYQIASSGAPKKRPDPATEEGQAIVREELDAVHAIFSRQVAEGRKTTVDRVNSEFGQGGMLLAVEAQRRGMIDSVKGITTSVAGSAIQVANNKQGRVKPMTLEQIKAEHPEIAAALRDEGIQAERKRIAELKSFSGINADADKAVEEAIANGKAYSEVAPQLAAAVARGNSKAADGDNASTVNSATASNGAGVDGFDEDDQKAMKLFGFSAEEYRKYKGGK